MAELFLTPEQVAVRLQLHPETIRRQLKAGRLRGVRRGRMWRVPESALAEAHDDVDALLDETAAAARRAGYANVEDVDRLIQQVRAEQELREQDSRAGSKRGAKI